MEKVIQFRSVTESFNNDEFRLFTKKLFKVYDKRSLLIRSLFFWLLNQSMHADYNDIQQINKICKSITDLRRKKSKSKTKRIEKTNQKTKSKHIEKTNKRKNSKPNYFNILPAAIISHTASYLRTSEQPQFMQCNRYIFISCSLTPSTVQNLCSTKWFEKYYDNHGQHNKEYQLLKLSKFRMAKKITLPYINIFVPPHGHWKWNNLNVLHIEFLSLRNCHSLINVLQNIEVKQFELSHIGFSDNIDAEKIESQKQSLLDLLSINKNIQFIYIPNFARSRNFDISFDLNLLKQRFNHLKGLGLTIGSIGSSMTLRDQLLSCLSQQIQSLHLHRKWERRMPLSSNNDICYTNLRELCMIRMDYTLLSNILRTANKLKRIYWEFAAGNMRIFEMNREHQQIVLKHILTQLKELQYLEILTSFNETIFEWIKQGFVEYKTKKKNIKLMITLRGDLDQNALIFIEENIEVIIDLIQKSVINDFLFSLTITINNDVEFKGIDNKLTNMASIIRNRYSIQNQTFTITHKYNIRDIGKRKVIHITNKNNSMNGYNEKWMFHLQQ